MMATEPSPDLPVPHSSPPLAAVPVDIEVLGRRLRLGLEQHIATQGFRPALTLIGFGRDATTVLRHGFEHPEDAILEFDLPPSYSALGVLASSVVATAPKRAHHDAALALGVTRGGEVVSLLATPERIIDTKDPQGWLIDACMRAVGQPTAPCRVAAIAFPIALWLDRLMVTIVNSENRVIGWSDAVALCPIPDRWRSDDPVDLGTTLGSTARSWSALRSAVARGEPPPVAVTARRAQWMDDAMFARWCMGSFPDLPSLRGDVEFLAPPEVAEGVELALRAAWVASGST